MTTIVQSQDRILVIENSVIPKYDNNTIYWYQNFKYFPSMITRSYICYSTFSTAILQPQDHILAMAMGVTYSRPLHARKDAGGTNQ